MRTRDLVALSKRYGRHLPIVAPGALVCSVCGNGPLSVTHSLIHSNRSMASVELQARRAAARKAAR